MAFGQKAKPENIPAWFVRSWYTPRTAIVLFMALYGFSNNLSKIVNTALFSMVICKFCASVFRLLFSKVKAVKFMGSWICVIQGSTPNNIFA